MKSLFDSKLKMDWLVNPFYIYAITFSAVFFVYIFGWSDLFPDLSSGLILFFIFSFALFIFFGKRISVKKVLMAYPKVNPHMNDVIFVAIVILGLINVLLAGYLPITDRTQNYLEFGAPVIDPIFNTLSIFFSAFFLESFLVNRKKRFLVYLFLLLFFQVLLFRRSTIVWITVSSTFMMILYFKKIPVIFLMAGLICIPIASFFFGVYGNYRSNLSEQFVIGELKASNSFRESGLSHNHYISYLYLASPLANLQKNVDEGTGFFNRKNVEKFIFYSLIPESFTIRLEKSMDLSIPECSLINFNLIVGTFLMVAFSTMGWAGMIIMLAWLSALIFICIYLLNRWSTFRSTTLAILSTAVSFLVFSNFLNRLDVIMMLFIYPVVFHYFYTLIAKEPIELIKVP